MSISDNFQSDINLMRGLVMDYPTLSYTSRSSAFVAGLPACLQMRLFHRPETE